MKIDIVRAWKDPMYRQSLAQNGWNELVPENPAGEQDLSEEELAGVSGAGGGGDGTLPPECFFPPTIEAACSGLPKPYC